MKTLQFFIIGAISLFGSCKYPENSVANATVNIEVVSNTAAKSIRAEAIYVGIDGVSEYGFYYMLNCSYGSGTDIQKKVCGITEPFIWNFKLTNDFNVKWIRAYVVVDDIYIYSNVVNIADLGVFLN